MFQLARFVNLRITSDGFDLRCTQLACYITAVGLMYFAMRAVSRLAATPGEAALGMILAVTAPLLFVVVGLLLPLASRAWHPRSRGGQSAG